MLTEALSEEGGTEEPWLLAGTGADKLALSGWLRFASTAIEKGHKDGEDENGSKVGLKRICPQIMVGLRHFCPPLENWPGLLRLARVPEGRV